MRQLAAVLLCASLAACGGAGERVQAQSSADAVTKAVYADDFDAVSTRFDDALKPQVTRTEVGLLSDKLHALGNYTGIAYVDGDPIKGEYTYRLTFDRGNMSVVVRLDGKGDLSAYRLFSQQS